MIKTLARESGINNHSRSFKGRVHYVQYVGQPYIEKDQGSSSCCLQLPNGTVWEETEPNSSQVHNGRTSRSRDKLAT